MTSYCEVCNGLFTGYSHFHCERHLLPRTAEAGGRDAAQVPSALVEGIRDDGWLRQQQERRPQSAPLLRGSEIDPKSCPCHATQHERDTGPGLTPTTRLSSRYPSPSRYLDDTYSSWQHAEGRRLRATDMQSGVQPGMSRNRQPPAHPAPHARYERRFASAPLSDVGGVRNRHFGTETSSSPSFGVMPGPLPPNQHHHDSARAAASAPICRISPRRGVGGGREDADGFDSGYRHRPVTDILQRIRDVVRADDMYESQHRHRHRRLSRQGEPPSPVPAPLLPPLYSSSLFSSVEDMPSSVATADGRRRRDGGRGSVGSQGTPVENAEGKPAVAKDPTSPLHETLEEQRGASHRSSRPSQAASPGNVKEAVLLTRVQDSPMKARDALVPQMTSGKSARAAKSIAEKERLSSRHRRRSGGPKDASCDVQVLSSRHRTSQERGRGADVSSPLPPDLEALRQQLKRDVARYHDGRGRDLEGRTELLRAGMTDLCAAVRRDLRRLRAEMEEVKQQQRQGSLEWEASPQLSARRVVECVADCSPAEKQRLAMLLRPYLLGTVQDEVRATVEAAMSEYRCTQQERLQTMERRIWSHAGNVATAASHDTSSCCCGARSLDQLWLNLSSAEAFNAHLRSTTRAVLEEEGDNLYGGGTEREQRHQRDMATLRREWREDLADAQGRWKTELKARLSQERSASNQKRMSLTMREELRQLEDRIALLEKNALISPNAEQQSRRHVSEVVQREKTPRQRDETVTLDELEHRIGQMVGDAVARQLQRKTVGCSSVPGAYRDASSRSGKAAIARECSCSTAADDLRRTVVEPALDHMRRVLATHQAMVDAAVKDRCTQAERAVEGSRQIWSQNIADVRSRLAALRTDVRGAFHELCQNINVSSPAM